MPSRDYIQIQPRGLPGADQLAPHGLRRTGALDVVHPSRLSRDQSGRFGSPEYGREELCAEMTSAFVCAALGIEPSVRHADYLRFVAGDPARGQPRHRAGRKCRLKGRRLPPRSHGRKRRRPTGPGRPGGLRTPTAGSGQGRRRPRTGGARPIEGKEAGGFVTGQGLGERLPAVRHRDLTWQVPLPSRSSVAVARHSLQPAGPEPCQCPAGQDRRLDRGAGRGHRPAHLGPEPHVRPSSTMPGRNRPVQRLRAAAASAPSNCW